MHQPLQWARAGVITALFGLAPDATALAAPESVLPLQTWDALPALDPLHLRGPHAGERVCPMCRYGYDAGVLVLLPATTDPAEIAAMAARLAALEPAAASGRSAPVERQRFRRFLLFAGPPSPAAIEAAARPGVQVAMLDTRWLKEAEVALSRPLREQAWGYVFAQRRLLKSFDPLQADVVGLQAFADYALQLLVDHYPEAVQAEDPDLPRGLLWAAPNRLGTALSLGASASEDSIELCLQRAQGTPVANALIEIALESERRPRLLWARSRADGCLQLKDPASVRSRVALRAFEPLQPALRFSLSGLELRQAQVRTLYAEDPSAPGLAWTTGVESGLSVLGPCEGCELALLGMPAAVGSQARLAPAAAAGERLQIEGVVRDAQGHAAAGVRVYAYQTDAAGVYPQPPWLAREATAHGALRGWAQTDDSGAYRFDTVRPGAYPGGTEPQHVHMHVIEPGRCTYYLDDLVFADDPLRAAAKPRDPAKARGGSGIVIPRIEIGEGWRVQRDLQLGLNIEGYARCGA